MDGRNIIQEILYSFCALTPIIYARDYEKCCDNSSFYLFDKLNIELKRKLFIKFKEKNDKWDFLERVPEYFARYETNDSDIYIFNIMDCITDDDIYKVMEGKLTELSSEAKRQIMRKSFNHEYFNSGNAIYLYTDKVDEKDYTHWVKKTNLEKLNNEIVKQRENIALVLNVHPSLIKELISKPEKEKFILHETCNI